MFKFIKIQKADEPTAQSEGFDPVVRDTQCPTCLWLNEDGGTCEAFPEGIPTEIILGVYDHRAYFDFDGQSDEGLRYTPVTSE